MRQQSLGVLESNGFVLEVERYHSALRLLSAVEGWERRRKKVVDTLPPASNLLDLIDPPDHGPSPEQTAARNEQLVRLRQAIDNLPPRARWVMQRLFLEGQSYAEVSRALAVRREYLRVIVHRATVDLRAALTGSPRPEPRPT